MTTFYGAGSNFDTGASQFAGGGFMPRCGGDGMGPCLGDGRCRELAGPRGKPSQARLPSPGFMPRASCSQGAVAGGSAQKVIMGIAFLSVCVGGGVKGWGHV